MIVALSKARLCRWLPTLLLSLACTNTWGNDNRPLFIEITETPAPGINLKWQSPPTVTANNQPQITLDSCTTSHSPRGHQQSHCSSPLAGSSLSIHYPQQNPMLATLVRIKWLNGETRTLSVSPGETEVLLPQPETTSSIATQYFVLGVEHIWAGLDHLLFIACLVIIAGTLRKMLITITGFTLAHSITLALAAHQWVAVPIAAVEAIIALSIVFLATELVRNNRNTLTWRYPVSVSSSFGLLHGFGFAAVLQDIGLPQTELGTALLFFNLGVEAGQIIYILSVLAALGLLTKTIRHVRSGTSQVATASGCHWQLGALQLPVAYVVGSTASFWLIERLMA